MNEAPTFRGSKPGPGHVAYPWRGNGVMGGQTVYVRLAKAPRATAVETPADAAAIWDGAVGSEILPVLTEMG